MIASIFIAIAGLASMTAAQSAGVGNQTIIPESVDLNTRNGWCRAEKNTCDTLCNKNWSTNECDVATLVAECKCSDGSTPPLAQYRDTLPFFVCQAYIGQCVDGNRTEPTLQNICRSSNTCGDMDPADVEFTTTLRTSTSSPSTTAGTGTQTDSPAETTGAGETSSPTTTPNAGMVVEPSTGFMKIAVLVVAMGLTGFGLVL